MRILKLENDMLKIGVEISRFRRGEPVFLADLRKRLPEMSKDDFDQAVLMMAKNGYFLSKHFHPASSTDAEKAVMIPDGKGNYFIAINPRDDVGTLAAVEKSDQPTAAKPGRGGSREGSGRPIKKFKRVPLQGARIPGWLMDWLKAGGGMGRKIEVALIEKYGLKSPTERDER